MVQPVILSRENKAKCDLSTYRELFICIGGKKVILVLCVRIDY